MSSAFESREFERSIWSLPMVQSLDGSWVALRPASFNSDFFQRDLPDLVNYDCVEKVGRCLILKAAHVNTLPLSNFPSDLTLRMNENLTSSLTSGNLTVLVSKPMVDKSI